ncbi:MAG: enoyl-CoA hydratase/isomerase family protein [Acidimicrobiales bacterium]
MALALSPAEALDLLRSPFAGEDVAGLALIVELSGPSTRADASTGPTADDIRVLHSLPAVTVAAVDTAEPLPAGCARWADACDLLVEDSRGTGHVPLSRVVSAIQDHPQAALVLVQILRRGPSTGSVTDGLVAESLAYSTLQGGGEFASWLATRPPGPDAGTPTAAPEDRPVVVVERLDSSIRLRLNRPEVHNALGVEMRDALVEALRALHAEPDARPVVLCGEGPSFCSGGDLREFGTLRDPATAHVVRTTRSPAAWMAALAPRLVAEVHGACVGAGVELAAFGGRVVAAPDAAFWLPELAMGLIPGAGGTVSLPRRIGRQRTALLALTGDAIDAGTALEWGLVDEIR